MKKMIFPVVVILIVAAAVFGVYFYLKPAKQNQTTINTPIPTSPVESANQDGTSTPSATPFPSGLKVEDLKIGQGLEVKSGDTISIHYLGTLENGQKFDSSYDRGQPFVTQIGVGRVIKGWDLGVLGMKVGGKRKLTIPPELGYGERGAGNAIPPNATLIFEVELVEIE